MFIFYNLVNVYKNNLYLKFNFENVKVFNKIIYDRENII